MIARWIAAIVLAVVAALSPAHAQERGTPAEAQAMAEAAAAYLAAAGPDTAIAAFNTAPEWRDRDLYVFAVGRDGIRLANGAQPEIVGQNVLDLTDANGVMIFRIMLAIPDRGWVNYLFHNTVTNADERKQSYVIWVGDILVGVGAYSPR